MIIIFLICISLIGCNEENNDNEKNDNFQNYTSWEIIDCSKKSINYRFNWTDDTNNECYSKITSSINNVSLSIENNGNQFINLKIDFEFILTEIIKSEETEILKITSEKCSCDSLENINNSYYSTRYISLYPQETKKVYSSIDIENIYGFKVTKWCFEINII